MPVIRPLAQKAVREARKMIRVEESVGVAGSEHDRVRVDAHAGDHVLGNAPSCPVLVTALACHLVTGKQVFGEF